MKNFVFILLLFSTNVFSHELDYSSDDVFKIYNNVNKAFEENSHQKQFITIKSKNGKTFQIEEGRLTKLIREGLKLNLDIVLNNCTQNEVCDPREVQEKFSKNLPEMTKATLRKIKSAGIWISDFIMDMLFDSVTGVRRYGVLYFVLVSTGEVIEHFVIHPMGIPVPLCKFVQVGTVKILAGVKTTFLTLFSRYPVNINLNKRFQMLAENYGQKKYFSKHINRFLAYSANPKAMTYSRFEKIKKLFQKINFFDDLHKDYYLHDFINKENPLVIKPQEFKNFSIEERYLNTFKVEREIQALNFLIDINEAILKALHEEDKLSLKDYIKAKWRLGEVGGFIDKFHVLIKSLNSTNNYELFIIEKEKIEKEVIRVLNEFSKNPTSNEAKLKIRELNKTLKLFELRKCFNLLTSNFVLN